MDLHLSVFELKARYSPSLTLWGVTVGGGGQKTLTSAVVTSSFSLVWSLLEVHC